MAPKKANKKAEVVPEPNEQEEEEVRRKIEQMEGEMKQLQRELSRGQEEVAHLHTLWEVTRRKIEVAEAELYNVDKGTEEDERQHREEVLRLKNSRPNPLKHEKVMEGVKEEGRKIVEAGRCEQEALEREAARKMKRIGIDMQNPDDPASALQREHAQNVLKTKNDVERILEEMEATNKKSLHLLQKELNNQMETAICERKGVLNSFVQDLTDKQNARFQEMVTLINSSVKEEMNGTNLMKKEIDELKLKHSDREKVKPRWLEENECLRARLTTATKEKCQLTYTLRNSRNPKHPEDDILERGLKGKRKMFEALELKLENLELERDELCDRFDQYIQAEQDREDQRIMPLQEEHDLLKERLEKTKDELYVKFSASNVDPALLSRLTDKNVEQEQKGVDMPLLRQVERTEVLLKRNEEMATMNRSYFIKVMKEKNVELRKITEHLSGMKNKKATQPVPQMSQVGDARKAATLPVAKKAPANVPDDGQSHASHVITRCRWRPMGSLDEEIKRMIYRNYVERLLTESESRRFNLTLARQLKNMEKLLQKQAETSFTNRSHFDKIITEIASERSKAQKELAEMIARKSIV